MKKVFLIAAALVMLAPKCGKPKPPRAEALDAVEEAWMGGQVDEELARHHEVWVDVDSLEVPASILFERDGAEVRATVHLDDATLAFVITADGLVEEATSEGR